MILHEDGYALPTVTVAQNGTGIWSQSCKISLGQPSTDMTCVLEASELDLYFNGTTLVWNGPAEQCAYVQVSPYYFYQFQPGVGPTTISATQTTTGSGNPITQITAQSGGTVAATVNASGTIVCAADYSGSLPIPGPNCCQGPYTLNLTSVSIQDGVTTTTGPVPESVEWGGNASNCLAGPAVDSQTKDSAGYPEPTLYFLNGKTVNQGYTVKPSLGTHYTNVYAANYFAPPYSNFDAGIGLSMDLATTPVPMQSPAGTGFRQATPWYEFSCLDNAHQYVHRIRVMIRSWDETSNLNQQLIGFSSQGGAQSLPFSDQSNYTYGTWLGAAPGFGLATYPGFGL
jgi:hypothetical protein